MNTPFWHVLSRVLHGLHFGAVGGLVFMIVAATVVSAVSPLLRARGQAYGHSEFAGTSLWNQAVPKATDLAGNSPAQAAAISTMASGYGAELGVGTGSPMYLADISTPTVSVMYHDCDGAALGGVIDTDWSAVPIPFYALPSSDGLLSVYMAATQTVWEFSGVYQAGGQWYACRGGKIPSTLGSSGVFAAPYGALGSGLSLRAAQVTAAELRSGQIGHVVGLYLPQVGSGSVSPARPVGGGGLVAPGQRLQLDPMLDVDTLGLNATARLLAKNAQRHGFVVLGTASRVTVAAENPLSYTSRGAASPYGGLYTSLAGFPWGSLRALPANYSQSMHVPAVVSFDVPPSVAANDKARLTWSANNIDSCAIPGVATNLGASGSATTRPLTATMVVTLSCSGPDGSVSVQKTISVAGGSGPVEGATPPAAVSITPPLMGVANIVPGLAEAVDPAVYKVGYYKGDDFIFSTTQRPFALDTTRLADGEHTLRVHVYYDDGTDAYQLVSMRVSNTPESLAVGQAALLPADTVPPYIVALLGAGVVVCAAGMAVVGWRWSHPGHHGLRRRKLAYY
ncbi:hypothetical protein CR970_04575 [Candidatus Saccharibacteria bacterium]|nr:MAG: hypothetical protein CR970_04575 [Candidatus Saccharibacteria bacterium]